MPNDTVRANAQTMPIDRRAAFTSIAAAGALLVVPRVAKAVTADAEVFAAVDRVKALQQVQDSVGERLSALDRQLPERPFLALRGPDGETLDHRELRQTEDALKLFGRLGIDESDPVLGSAFARAAEICRTDKEWIASWSAAKERLGYEEAEEAFNDAVDVTDDAARELLDLRPHTIAGLRAIVETLLAVKFFETEHGGGEALAQLLIAAPALATEA